MARRPAALPAVLKYSRTSASSLIEMWTFQTVCRRPLSPRRHGGHGDFTEASGFSVHLRVLRVSVVNKVLGLPITRRAIIRTEILRFLLRPLRPRGEPEAASTRSPGQI